MAFLRMKVLMRFQWITFRRQRMLLWEVKVSQGQSSDGAETKGQLALRVF
jgi:hypothetical protein